MHSTWNLTDTTHFESTNPTQQPFKLLDFVGLDTTSYIADGWRDKAEQGVISKELVQPIPMMEQMVKDGKLGRKSGKGFYDVSMSVGDGR